MKQVYCNHCGKRLSKDVKCHLDVEIRVVATHRDVDLCHECLMTLEYEVEDFLSGYRKKALGGKLI